MFAFAYLPIFIFIVIFINAWALDIEIKKEYDILPHDRTFIEKSSHWINFIIKCLIPMYNILLLIMAIERSHWKKNIINSYRRENRIKEKEAK